MRHLPAILLSFCVAACTTQPANKFTDGTISKIHDLKDRRVTDSLLLFLQSPNKEYRLEAASAFASVQDSSASSALGTTLLEDGEPSVRMNAAFSLGQTAGVQATNALIPALSDKDRDVVREVLEALGKTIQKEDLGVLIGFHSNDTLLQEGQAWAYYHLVLRKKADSLVTREAARFLLPSYSYQTRLAAAHFFSRSSKEDGKGFGENLIRASMVDSRAEVRMAAVNGFRHLDMAQALPVLKKIYTSEPDYRVRISAVRVSQNFSTDKDQEVIFAGLKDSVEMVQVAASEVLRNMAGKELMGRIAAAVPETKSPRAQANLYAALLRSAQAPAVLGEMLKRGSTASPYAKAALLSSLGEALPPADSIAFKFLSREMTNPSNEKVVLTSAASAVVSLDRKAGGSVKKKDFLRMYQQAIAQGDVAVIGTICSALVNESLHYRDEIKDLGFLYAAKSKFTLPRDIESLQPLEEAIAYLEGKEKPKPIQNAFNHPIDWRMVRAIPANQQVEITTTKGTISIRLLVEEAPGSTGNFVDLVSRKYFDGKFFHRVVPNFVIQAGCNRGDGYGSEDYSIRSEFSRRRYTTGSVGMASAGKDTEGTQWFITHSPTPHLNGRYTIFAEVISGMEVVHRMEVGDRMLEVRLKK